MGLRAQQDDKYGVKVVAEEAISLKWQVDEYAYSVPGKFMRLKELGFTTREELARFFEFLPALVKLEEYDLENIARLLNKAEPPPAEPVFSVARPARGGDRGRVVAEGLGGTGAGRLRFRRDPSRLAMACDNMLRRGEKRMM